MCSFCIIALDLFLEGCFNLWAIATANSSLVLCWAILILFKRIIKKNTVWWSGTSLTTVQFEKLLCSSPVKENCLVRHLRDFTCNIPWCKEIFLGFTVASVISAPFRPAGWLEGFLQDARFFGWMLSSCILT